MSRLSGVGVSPGVAAGPLVPVAGPLGEPPAGPEPADPAAEAARIAPAAKRVADRLNERAEAAAGEAAVLLQTTAAMAADPALITAAEQLVGSHQLPAARAVHLAAGGFIDSLIAAGGYLAERVTDVADIRDRVVAELLDRPAPGVPQLTRPSVLVAADLAPADTAGLPPDLVLALVTESGGPTSHTAILARSLGIPAVVACRGLLAATAGANYLVVDGESGEVEVSGGPVEVRGSRRSPVEWDGGSLVASGGTVGVLANVGSAADAEAAAAAGAHGVGLFRTEFSYLAATGEPDVAAQRADYAAVLAPFAGSPVVVRTLDAGADKPLGFLHMPDEPNPALGVRGLRIATDRTEVLDRQLGAIAAAADDTGADVAVMAPMVATAEEAAWFVARARAAGLPRAGVMIEIPAAALAAAELFEVVDFVSIGTNDLAQYTFAADRQLGELAALNDPWQPALLRLVGMVGTAARTAGKPAGVCGEAAADPLLARVLVGLGATSLSMSVSALPAVGAALAAADESTCASAAAAAIAAPTATTARTAATHALTLS